MSTINYLTVRNTVLPVVTAARVNYSTLTGSTITGSAILSNAITTNTIATSTITVSTLNLASTTISLGQSTNQTYNNFSNGSYLTWVDAKSALSGTNKTVMSANGLYQMIVGNATSGLFLSSDSGITWTALTGGLPVLTGSAYWSDGAISANGQYITLSIYGGSLWMSADYGRTFALTNQPTPTIWLPLNGNTTDLMGSSTVTVTGSPSYVTLNYPGYTAQAVNLANTAGGTATRYVQGTWAGATNFTVNLWFNTQTTSAAQTIFRTSTGQIQIYIASGVLYYAMASGGSFINISTSTFSVTINTWYYITITFQTNGSCSIYVNNTLLGSTTNVGGLTPWTGFFIGCDHVSQTTAFNGYVDDLKITNSVSTYVPIPLLQPNIWMPFETTAGDLGSHSLPPSATPTIYLPFEGNVADSMNPSTPAIATGPVTYVAANREGYTGQAIRLTNTAGGTAAQYVRGTWAGANNFTISLWFNSQTVGTQQVILGAYNGGFNFYITAANVISCGITNLGTILTGPAITANTWYYVVLIMQTSGLCSMYVNNVLTSSATPAAGGWSAYSTSVIQIGSQDLNSAQAFNGRIDDLRIYNSVIPYVPVSVVNVTGSLSYVPGVVGLNAVNLVNTAGGTATNYFTVAWTTTPNSTISMWFNLQSATGTWNELFCADALGWFETFIHVPTMTLNVQIPSGGTQLQLASAPITLNTWYHLVHIFQTNGTCSVFLNGVSIGSATNTSGTTGTSWTNLTIGRETATNSSAFNGYIDDLRIYNAAIPIHQLLPQNYRSLALSGTGQYALASAASGWVVGSSNSSQTWSKQAVNVGTQNDFIQPNMIGLSANTWIANGVTWTSSANVANQPAYNAFNNNFTTGNNWLGQLGPGRYNASGVYTGTESTTILGGIGSIGGEWVQIQSSVPLILSNYSYAVGGALNQPKTMYIVGSADGLTNWYPLQLHVLTANPFNTDFTAASTFIIMNLTGTQTVTAQTSQTVTTTAYASTTQAFTYFRFIINTNFLTSVDCGALGELYLNFVRPLTSSRPPTHALSLNHTGQYQLVATGPVSGSVMPNRAGITSSGTALITAPWTQSGVTWVASASNVNSATLGISNLFNTLYTNTNIWATGNLAYTSSGNTSGITTVVQGGVNTVTGDWVQIQSSVPLVISSYQFATGFTVAQLPKTYYIVGSNDGSTWNPIQYGAGGAVTTTATNTLIPGIIIVNSAGAQTFGSSTITTTIYSTTTNAYTYFRLIMMSTYNGVNLEIAEWLINFSNSVSYSTNYGTTWLNTRSTASNESVALSPSGQYVLSTNSVTPFARLTLDNTNADAQSVLVPATGAGTVTYSTSIKAVGTHSGQFANTAGGTPSVYLNYTAPTALSTPSTLTMACWVYPSAYGVASNSYILNLGSTATHGCTLGFGADGVVFSYTGKTSGGAQQTIGAGIAPLNTWTHVAMTYNANLITLYVNGVVSAQSAITGNLSLVGGGNITNLLVGCSIVSQALNGYVDDVRIYTSALSATAISALYNNPTMTQSQIVAVSNSYLPITSYTYPALSGINANVVDTAVSQTGQYMVAVTSSTTNNVYYSTDFGATFTALTIGSLAMVSCSISYDGTYLTAMNATTTYTLNRNTRGFTLAIGNQAGRVNQGLNAIAIGDKAGQTNQSNNSIVLNATGVALDAVAPGFYVAPVAMAGVSSQATINLLGYGADSQIVNTGASVMAKSNTTLDVAGDIASKGQLCLWDTSPPVNGAFRITTAFGTNYIQSGLTLTSGSKADLVFGSMFAGSEWMRIASTGYVGIGTATPSTYLHISGPPASGATTGQLIQRMNTVFTPGVQYGQSAGFALCGGTTTSDPYGRLDILVNNTAVSGNNMGQTPNITVASFCGNGNVGIGTPSPIAALHVNSSVFASGIVLTNTFNSSTGSLSFNIIPPPGGNFINNSTGNASVILPADGNDLYLCRTSAFNCSMVIRGGTGNVGIGTTNPTVPLHVIGAILATGDITAFSDQRYKQNIVRLHHSLDAIRSLSGYSYTRNDYQPGIRQIGLLAQEVKEIIPEAVKYDSINDIYSVNYNCLIAPIVEAIKELYDRGEAQAKVIEAQQAIIQKLIDRLGQE